MRPSSARQGELAFGQNITRRTHPGAQVADLRIPNEHLESDLTAIADIVATLALLSHATGTGALSGTSTNHSL